jgi:Transferrin
VYEILFTVVGAGQYFSKSCVPGALSSYYNPFKTNPVSLCEACQTSGPKRCLRNDDELYYGASGAFRCVTESKFLFKKNKSYFFANLSLM